MAGKTTFQFIDEPTDAGGNTSYQFIDEPTETPKGWGMKDIVREPFAITADGVAMLANLPIKATKGLMGIGSMVNSGLNGGTLNEALQAGTDTIGNRNVIKSFLPSKTFGAINENVIAPSISGVAGLLGTDPSNVAAFVEAGGDIAALIGLGMGKGSPTAVAANRVGNAAKVGADKVSSKLMSSTLKPKSKTLAANAAEVRTALEGNFMPNLTGARKLDTEIGSLETLLSDGLARGEAQGVTGSFQQAINNVEGLRGQASNTGNYSKNAKLIDLELARMRGNPELGNVIGAPLDVPIRKMQEMKVQQGRDLQRVYGEEKPQFQTSIDKARVRGFKEELESKLDVAFPELAATNKKLGTYYQLKKSLDAAVKREADSSSILKGMGYQAAAGTAAGGFAGGTTGAAIGGGIGVALSVIRHPAIAPLLARQLYKVNKGKMTHKQAMDSVNARILGVTAELGVNGEYE